MNPEFVTRLRALAVKGAKPSAMLRELSQALGPTDGHKLVLIKYARKAFDLSLQQASPIAGWAADGTGELSDSRLDEILAPEVSALQNVNGQAEHPPDVRASR